MLCLGSKNPESKYDQAIPEGMIFVPLYTYTSLHNVYFVIN